MQVFEAFIHLNYSPFITKDGVFLFDRSYIDKFEFLFNFTKNNIINDDVIKNISIVNHIKDYEYIHISSSARIAKHIINEGNCHILYFINVLVRNNYYYIEKSIFNEKLLYKLDQYKKKANEIIDLNQMLYNILVKFNDYAKQEKDINYSKCYRFLPYQSLISSVNCISGISQLKNIVNAIDKVISFVKDNKVESLNDITISESNEYTDLIVSLLSRYKQGKYHKL